jgi:hypothetical protein
MYPQNCFPVFLVINIVGITTTSHVLQGTERIHFVAVFLAALTLISFELSNQLYGFSKAIVCA